MRRILSICIVLFITCSLSAQLTIEKIMQDPVKWIGSTPNNLIWSDDSKTLYFNWDPELTGVDSLYKYNLDKKIIEKVPLSEERLLPLPSVWSFDRSKKIYDRDGDIYIKNMLTLQERRLTNTKQSKEVVCFNVDESKVIYTSGNDFFSIDLQTGLIEQLTEFIKSLNSEMDDKDANPAYMALMRSQQELFEFLRVEKKKNESSNEYYELTQKKKYPQIEIGERKIVHKDISPDLRYVYYQLENTGPNNQPTIIANYVTPSGYTQYFRSRPKVGLPSAVPDSYIYDIKRDTIISINTETIPGIRDFPEYLSEYEDAEATAKRKNRAVTIYGPTWSPLGTHAIVVVLSQDHKDRWIMELNPEDGSLALIDRQHDEAWIGGPGISRYSSMGVLNFLDEHTIYFQSEASGYSHIYTYDLQSGKKRQLTSGDYEVLDLDLSKDKKWFYFTTNEVHPGETYLYKMPVTGGQKIQLTKMEGGNFTLISPDEKSLAIKYSNANTPWEIYIQKNQPDALPIKITASTTEAFRSYPWRMPEFISFKARDGHKVYARVYKPEKSNGKGVIFVHGAGYLQNAHKWWSSYYREYMFHNLLADKGYTVMDIDYRASSGYGRDTRTGIYRHMGGKDLDDNVDGAKLLVSKYGVQPDKIGIYGGSYGGFITLMAMFTAPDVFAAGAALRPVTDWAAYNQGYTSRILNEPQNDSIAYRRSSPIFFAEGLKGKLLICHGQVDDNVHIQDSYRLAQRLIELRKENWEMASYPAEDHGFIYPSSWIDEYKRILKLFESM